MAERPVVSRRRRAEVPEPPPWLAPHFIGWALARLVALAVLVGTAWVVYDAASSDRFQVRSVRVEGAKLLSQAEVERAAGVKGANLFWVDRGQVEARLRSLPTVLNAEVTPLLPDTVSVHIVERQPAAYWISGEQSYLVDSAGIILRTVDGAAVQAGGLPTVAQPEGPPLSPGDQVDAGALATSARLAGLLPRAGIQPLAFEWSADGGLEVPTQEGWRARFDGQRGDVERQVDALKSIRALLQKTRASAELIDVRYGDRPYYR